MVGIFFAILNSVHLFYIVLEHKVKDKILFVNMDVSDKWESIKMLQIEK